MPWSIVYLEPKKTTSPAVTTTRPSMPGWSGLPRKVRSASACRFWVRVVRNWTSGAVRMRTSKRMPPRNPVLAVAAGGGVAAEESIEPISECEWSATSLIVTFPETRLRDVVPFNVILALIWVVTDSG